MVLRKAEQGDIARLMEVFEAAKKIMRDNGNHRQWNANYPSLEVVCKDIKNGNCYVCCDGNRITATMALIPGPDPTYKEIEGKWENDDPYYTIHRMAVAEPGHGLARKMLDWAFEHIEGGRKAIRIDTHRDNSIMKHILENYGFRYSGVIRLADGSPRDAYMLINSR